MARYSKSRVDRAGRFFADQVPVLAEAPDRLRDPGVLKQGQEALAIVEWWRSEHARPLSRVAANLRHYAGEHGKPIVTQRLKRVPTIAGKLARERSMKLSRMADIGGVRAVVPDQNAAYDVAARLRRNWTITKYRDYVANPKPDGYRSLHLINRHRGQLIEVQLRTPNQDFWANGVELFSRAVAPGLKFGGGPDWLRTYFRLVGEFLWMLDQNLEVDPELFAQVQELHSRVSNVITESSHEPR